MKVGRKATVPVFLKPILIIEMLANLSDRFANRFLLLR